MKRISIILFVLLISCNTFKNITSSTYQKKGSDFFYSLKLDAKDSTFVFTKKYFEVNSSCTGKWQQKRDTIFLKCKEEKDVGIMLSSGYMNQRDYTIKILSSNKLKLDKVILVRQ